MEHCLVELALGYVVAGGFGLPVFGETDGGHGHYDVPWVWGCAGVGRLGHGAPFWVCAPAASVVWGMGVPRRGAWGDGQPG
ncbi:MAG: hypothetical protein ACLP1Q_13020 [Solirubrobacteraceae bacterium]